MAHISSSCSFSQVCFMNWFRPNYGRPIIFLPCSFFMVALCNRADHYIFCHVISIFLWPPYVIGGPLYFCPVVSFFFLSFFISSPNLSGRRLDVYHTLKHGVALVRILNAGLKCAARGSLQIRDAKKVAKNRHLGTISQLCRAISSQLSIRIDNRKKLIKQQYLPYIPPQYGELRHTRG